MSRNSSTESVFHLSMANVSATDSSSSRSLMMGSAPLTYLMVRPGYLAGRLSDLMNACTCGYAPSRNPHTSRMALEYLTASSSFLPSSVQHRPQSLLRSPRENRPRVSQSEHIRLGVLKPNSEQFRSTSLPEVPSIT